MYDNSILRLLKTLASCLLLSLTAFSQQGTIVLDYTTAKEIAVDLVRGDSTAAELKATKRMVTILETQLAVREKEVGTLRDKNGIYREQIGAHKEKEVQYSLFNQELRAENETLKGQVKLLGIAVGVTSIAATIGFMLR